MATILIFSRNQHLTAQTCFVCWAIIAVTASKAKLSSLGIDNTNKCFVSLASTVLGNLAVKLLISGISASNRQFTGDLHIVVRLQNVGGLDEA